MQFVFLTPFLLFVATAARSQRRSEISDMDIRPELRLNNHQPCTRGPDDLWTEKIRFPKRAEGAKLLRNVRHPGCYKIGGSVSVFDNINADLKVYVELKHSERDFDGLPTMPEPCQNYDHNGCEGYGSCMYCDTCANRRKKLEKRERYKTGAHLKVKGARLRCDHTFTNGTNHNVYLHFCLPTKREFLENGMDEETFDDLMSGKSGMPCYLYIRLFESKNINYVFQVSMAMESRYRELHEYPPNQKVDRDYFLSTPFGNMVFGEQPKGFISCHRVAGTVRMPRRRTRRND